MQTSPRSADALSLAASGPEPLLEIRGLEVKAATPRAEVTLLRQLDLVVRPGSRVGIVGESGSGKSMTASAIMGLLPRGVRLSGGSITFRGRDLTTLDERQLNTLRGKEIAIVYQNALASLHPMIRIGHQIAATYRTHVESTRAEAWDVAVEMLETLGVPAARERARDYPHQFSGGMAQRVAIAMALVSGPALLIADEPTTGLDATIQAQVLEVMDRSVHERGAALLMISHDLPVIEAMCDAIAVVYAGTLLEFGSAEQVLKDPLSPYTRNLIRCLSPAEGQISYIPGRIPDPGAIGEQCPFADRCELVSDRCHSERPRPRELANDHWVACHNV